MGFAAEKSSMGWGLRNITRLARTACKELQEFGLFPLRDFRQRFAKGWRHFLQCLALAFDADLQVQGGGLDVGMPEPVFDHGDVVAGLDEVQGGGMSKGMRGDIASL